jgi:hypothetical protein
VQSTAVFVETQHIIQFKVQSTEILDTSQMDFIK